MEPFHSGTLAGIGSFQCKTCDYVVSLAAEDTLPQCPGCGGRELGPGVVPATVRTLNEGRRLMLRFLGLVVLIGTTFVLGYYIGQRPISELRKTVRDLSRDVLDTTLGIERNLRQRSGLVDAKSRLIQAKSELLDRNFGSAAKELAARQLDQAK